MIKLKNWILVAVSCLFIAFLQISSSALAKHSPDFVFNQIEPAQEKSTSSEQFYNRASQELPEDYYVLYRVIERLARANGLDERPWRVRTSQEYNINAFATDINLLVFYNGLLDQMDGDSNALACVVGHEMGHHVRNHIVIGEAEKTRIRQQLRAEAIEEVAREQEDLRDDLEGLGIGEWVTRGSGSLIDHFGGGGLGGVFSNVFGGIFRGQRARRVEAAARRIDQIYAEKQAQVEQQWTELSHRQEFEADESGYVYATQAGFQSGGCLTAMQVLGRVIGSTNASSTHPAVPDRITRLNNLGSRYSSASLVDEGRRRLAANPQPLTYAISRDGASLRIDSRSGSSGFEGSFPQ